VNLPDGLLALLRQPSPCYLSTLMPDGSPQLTQTWVDTDGEYTGRPIPAKVRFLRTEIVVHRGLGVAALGCMRRTALPSSLRRRVLWPALGSSSGTGAAKKRCISL
jgi:hypothetical protein